MKDYISALYLLIIVLLTPTVGCTNGGDIGPLYGEWSLKSYTVDGVSADIDTDLYYWQFQSDVICIVTVLPHNGFMYSFGTWRRTSDTLTLNFTHTSADEVPESSAYNPPPELGIPARATTDMHIISISDSKMQLSFTDSYGIQRLYLLKKLK